jgi:hypothetical protein
MNKIIFENDKTRTTFIVHTKEFNDIFDKVFEG